MNRYANRGSRAPIKRTALLARRATIIESILRFMLRQRVVLSSLNELASAAGMSVSLLLYYFPNREAVHQYLVRAIAGKIIEELNACGFAPPEKRIELLTNYLFDGRAIPRAYGVMAFEQMAWTTRDPKFRGQAKRMVNDLQRSLRELLQGAPMGPEIDVGDAAIIIGSLGMGLFIYSYYQPLTRSHARNIFRRQLLQLAGLDDKGNSAIPPSRSPTSKEAFA